MVSLLEVMRVESLPKGFQVFDVITLHILEPKPQFFPLLSGLGHLVLKLGNLLLCPAGKLSILHLPPVYNLLQLTDLLLVNIQSRPLLSFQVLNLELVLRFYLIYLHVFYIFKLTDLLVEVLNLRQHLFLFELKLGQHTYPMAYLLVELIPEHPILGFMLVQKP